MKNDGVIYLIFLLIMAYIVSRNWQAFNALADTGSAFAQHYTQILQGRSPTEFIRT